MLRSCRSPVFRVCHLAPARSVVPDKGAITFVMLHNRHLLIAHCRVRLECSWYFFPKFAIRNAFISGKRHGFVFILMHFFVCYCGGYCCKKSKLACEAGGCYEKDDYKPNEFIVFLIVLLISKVSGLGCLRKQN